MNVYNASIHVSIFQNFVCHICHFGDLSKAVKRNLTVNTFITSGVRFLCQLVSINPGAMAIDPDLLWFQFFYQRFGKEMNGGFGDAVNQR